MLQQEKDQHKKTTDDSTQLKQEKARIENEYTSLQKQVQHHQGEIKRLTDEMVQFRQSSIKVSQDLLETRVRAESKEEEVKKLNDDVATLENELKMLKEKEIQIRKIAKRYKDQYLELKTQIDSGSAPMEQGGENPAGDPIGVGEPSTSSHEQIEVRVQELQHEIEAIRTKNSELQRTNEDLQAAINKEESCKQLLSQAKNKIAQLNERKEQLTREVNGLKSQHDNRSDEHDQIMRSLKAQYETRIQRLEKDNADLVNEKSEFMQRLNQLHYRQMGSNQMSSKPSTSTMEKISSDAATRTANVKPQMMVAGPSQQQSATVQPWRSGVSTNTSSGETPLASIRPISVQNSRTAAVMPTTNVSNAGSSSTSAQGSSSVTALVSPQQVHTTASNQPSEAMSSSPTSSHTDYMPATSSATVVVAAVTPQLNVIFSQLL